MDISRRKSLADTSGRQCGVFVCFECSSLFSLLHLLSGLAGPLFLYPPISAFLHLASRSVTSPRSRLPPRRAAWSGDCLACSWFNNSFVTLRLFVLQRRRLRPAILKIWCAHMISLHACSHTAAYADQANKWRMEVWLRGKYFDIWANRLDAFGHRGFGHRNQCHSPF